MVTLLRRVPSIFPTVDEEELRCQLKKAFSRLKIKEHKPRSNARITTAMLLEHCETESRDKNHAEQGKILAKSLIRDRHLAETFSTLAVMCEMVLKETEVIRRSSKKGSCPADLKPAICTLIYCSKWLNKNNHNVEELGCVRKQFKKTYGKNFVQKALSNSEGCVSDEFLSKLSTLTNPISQRLVEDYLKAFRDSIAGAPLPPPSTGSEVIATTGVEVCQQGGGDGDCSIAVSAFSTVPSMRNDEDSRDRDRDRALSTVSPNCQTPMPPSSKQQGDGGSVTARAIPTNLSIIRTDNQKENHNQTLPIAPSKHQTPMSPPTVSIPQGGGSVAKSAISKGPTIRENDTNQEEESYQALDLPIVPSHVLTPMSTFSEQQSGGGIGSVGIPISVISSSPKIRDGSDDKKEDGNQSLTLPIAPSNPRTPKSLSAVLTGLATQDDHHEKNGSQDLTLPIAPSNPRIDSVSSTEQQQEDKGSQLHVSTTDLSDQNKTTGHQQPDGNSSSPGIERMPLKCPDVMTQDHNLSMFSPTLPYRIFTPNPALEIAFDVRTKNPVYVMERLEVKNRTPNSTTASTPQRRPKFFEETSLPEPYRSRLSDYFLSGYDRGHLAPAADYDGEEEGRDDVGDDVGDENGGNRRADTFTLCNVSPQVHALNISTWSKLERWCRRVARDELLSNGTTYVVTGPLWLPIETASSSSASGSSGYEFKFAAIGGESSAGRTPIHVPTHFFKVLAVIRQGSIHKFACFVVPNAEPSKEEDDSLQNHLVKWGELESVSGLQFFPCLANTMQEGWKETVYEVTDRALLESTASIMSVSNATSPMNSTTATDEESSLPRTLVWKQNDKVQVEEATPSPVASMAEAFLGSLRELPSLCATE